MRVLLLAPHPFFQDRGTPIAEKALVEALVRSGHTVDLLAFHEGEDVEIEGCRIHRISGIPFVRGVRPGFSLKKLVCDALLLVEAIRLVRRHRYDVVHAVEESVFMAQLLRRWFGLPFVYDMDSSLAEQMVEKLPVLQPASGLLRAFEGSAVRSSLGVVAVCRSLGELALEYDPEAFLAVIEDATLVSESGRTVESLAETIGHPGPIVLYVGNLEPYQGVDVLLEGLPSVLSERPDAQLVVIGGADADVARLRSRARELGAATNAHFLGPRPVDDLGAYLRQASVLVSPRLQGRNTPMKVYSYLDSGRPLVATDLLTHTQVLDGEIALLVPPTASGLARGIRRLLDDPQLGQALARRARERVRDEFSRAAFQRKVDRFYGEVRRRLEPGPSAPSASVRGGR